MTPVENSLNIGESLINQSPLMLADVYPIEKIRKSFPGLERKLEHQQIAYFDGPGGSQVLGSVIDKMASYMSHGVANVGGVYEASIAVGDVIDAAREAAAIFLNVSENEVAFGANTTTLAFRAARAIGYTWKRGDGNVVTTELDHHANIDPWVTAAAEKELDNRSLPLNPETLTLELDNLNTIIDENTKLVAIGLASNAVGTINKVDQIIQRANDVGAIVVIDAVHAAPHFRVDVKKLNADLVFCSAYKFFGPHVGLVAIRREVFEKLPVFKLEPASISIPEKMETGTLNFEGLVGVREAIYFIASLGEGSSVKDCLEDGYTRIENYEDQLAGTLRDRLRAIPGITLYQAPEKHPKTPTVAFTVDDADPEDVCRQMASQAINIESGDFYAKRLIKKIGLEETGGLIRAGLAPYNSMQEIERLITGIESLRS